MKGSYSPSPTTSNGGQLPKSYATQGDSKGEFSLAGANRSLPYSKFCCLINHGIQGCSRFDGNPLCVEWILYIMLWVQRKLRNYTSLGDAKWQVGDSVFLSSVTTLQFFCCHFINKLAPLFPLHLQVSNSKRIYFLSSHHNAISYYIWV